MRMVSAVMPTSALARVTLSPMAQIAASTHAFFQGIAFSCKRWRSYRCSWNTALASHGMIPLSAHSLAVLNVFTLSRVRWAGLPGGSSGSRSRSVGFQHIGLYWQQAPAPFSSELQHVLMVLQHARPVSDADIGDLCCLQQAIEMFFIL